MAAQQSPSSVVGSRRHLGALCSTGELLRRSSAVSIVQRLALREVSGQRLDVRIHQHYGYQMCYEWRGTFGTRSFTRRFRSYDAVADFCIRIATCPREGKASCITARDEFRPVRTSALLEMLHDRTEFCRAFLDVTLPPHIDQPWYTLRKEKEWQEDELEGNFCWHWMAREDM
jgi:hypothetical protein